MSYEISDMPPRSEDVGPLSPELLDSISRVADDLARLVNQRCLPHVRPGTLAGYHLAFACTKLCHASDQIANARRDLFPLNTESGPVATGAALISATQKAGEA